MNCYSLHFHYDVTPPFNVLRIFSKRFTIISCVHFVFFFILLSATILMSMVWSVYFHGVCFLSKCAMIRMTHLHPPSQSNSKPFQFACVCERVCGYRSVRLGKWARRERVKRFVALKNEHLYEKSITLWKGEHTVIAKIMQKWNSI